MSLEERRMWGGMRMDPRDILDVNGTTYTYLINGHGPEENWTGLFRPGERVRLRVINASAMSIFNVRIPGLAMTVRIGPTPSSRKPSTVQAWAAPPWPRAWA